MTNRFALFSILALTISPIHALIKWNEIKDDLSKVRAFSDSGIENPFVSHLGKYWTEADGKKKASFDTLLNDVSTGDFILLNDQKKNVALSFFLRVLACDIKGYEPGQKATNEKRKDRVTHYISLLTQIGDAVISDEDAASERWTWIQQLFTKNRGKNWKNANKKDVDEHLDNCLGYLESHLFFKEQLIIVKQNRMVSFVNLHESTDGKNFLKNPAEETHLFRYENNMFLKNDPAIQSTLFKNFELLAQATKKKFAATAKAISSEGRKKFAKDILRDVSLAMLQPDILGNDEKLSIALQHRDLPKEQLIELLQAFSPEDAKLLINYNAGLDDARRKAFEFIIKMDFKEGIKAHDLINLHQYAETLKEKEPHFYESLKGLLGRIKKDDYRIVTFQATKDFMDLAADIGRLYMVFVPLFKMESMTFHDIKTFWDKLKVYFDSDDHFKKDDAQNHKISFFEINQEFFRFDSYYKMGLSKKIAYPSQFNDLVGTLDEKLNLMKEIYRVSEKDDSFLEGIFYANAKWDATNKRLNLRDLKETLALLNLYDESKKELYTQEWVKQIRSANLFEDSIDDVKKSITWRLFQPLTSKYNLPGLQNPNQDMIKRLNGKVAALLEEKDITVEGYKQASYQMAHFENSDDLELTEDEAKSYIELTARIAPFHRNISWFFEKGERTRDNLEDFVTKLEEHFKSDVAYKNLLTQQAFLENGYDLFRAGKLTNTNVHTESQISKLKLTNDEKVRLLQKVSIIQPKHINFLKGVFWAFCEWKPLHGNVEVKPKADVFAMLDLFDATQHYNDQWLKLVIGDADDMKKKEKLFTSSVDNVHKIFSAALLVAD